jgi:hypothetical protein
MRRTLQVKFIKASSDGKPRLSIQQGDKVIRLRVKQAQSLAAVINRKYGKSVVFD